MLRHRRGDAMAKKAVKKAVTKKVLTKKVMKKTKGAISDEPGFTPVKGGQQQLATGAGYGAYSTGIIPRKR